ncbi:hypothetical protein SAMN04487989_101693 [Bizionia echini]|uniref:Acyl carrier protein n=1 Tax=Bizionia echini TaxID=649333 RepID=A0A1I4ZCH3_9FLAO|nr:hypothetical protein [Bizionia echini]SFN47590.1 hypothetical protein SAMN04487989_101693 [Bizionia echini]
MVNEDLQNSVKQLFVAYFNIKEAQFNWHVPLEQLDEDFRTLRYLVYLEQLINTEFNAKVLLMEKINASIHTPTDIIKLVETELN